MAAADRVEIGFYVELSENAARDDDPLLLLQQGTDQLDQGNWESAVATFERLLMLDPEDLMAKRALDDAQTRLEEENFRASNEGNVAYWETGIRNGIKESDLTQQVFYARKTLEVRPDHELALRVREDAWKRTQEGALRAAERGQSEDLAELWEAYRKDWPEDPRAETGEKDALSAMVEERRIATSKAARTAIARGDQSSVRSLWEEHLANWPADQPAQRLRELDLAEVARVRTALAPFLANPIYSDDESTGAFLLASLETGSVALVEKLKRDLMKQPYEYTALSTNLLTSLGREAGVPALSGEIVSGEIRAKSGQVEAVLVFDTNSGASGMFTELGGPARNISFRRFTGLPAAPVAGDDPRFTLLMRRSGTGETQDAYLYSASTGQGLRFPGINKSSTLPPPISLNGLPTLEGPVATVELQAASGATVAFMVLDGGSGDVHRIEVAESGHLSEAKKQPYNLFSVFPRDAGSVVGQRFLAVPVQNGSGATRNVLVVDSVNGTAAILERVDKNAQELPARATGTLFRAQQSELTRVWTFVPLVAANGATEGAWFFDSAGNRLRLLDIGRGLELRLRAEAPIELQ